MDIKHAIESIQSNILFNTHEKMGFMGLLQELQQYRDNPLARMEPCWSWVRKNDINQQLIHVLQECREVEQANNLNDIALEFWDILQGAVTGIFILKIKYGVDLDKLFKDGVRKNFDRGYYK